MRRSACVYPHQDISLYEYYSPVVSKISRRNFLPFFPYLVGGSFFHLAIISQGIAGKSSFPDGNRKFGGTVTKQGVKIILPKSQSIRLRGEIISFQLNSFSLRPFAIFLFHFPPFPGAHSSPGLHQLLNIFRRYFLF